MNCASVANASQNALKPFGYTERDAAFLDLVGAHGGYFLRSQYLRFLGRTAGGTAARLTDLLVENGHANVLTFVGNRHIYHLCARRFYRAIGLENSRNRRDRQPLTIKSKLMMLDFLISHPQHHYFRSENELLAYFVNDLGIGRELLPSQRFGASGDRATVRFFVERFPIFVPLAPGESRLEIGFCYVDPGATTVCGFETFLGKYRALFRSLAAYRVVYVATRARLFEAARRAYERVMRPELPLGAKGPDHLTPDLSEYFELRKHYETGDRSSFDRQLLLRLRDGRVKFASSEHEAKYAAWMTNHENHSDSFDVTNETSPAGSGTFSTCILDFDYEVFGDLSAF